MQLIPFGKFQFGNGCMLHCSQLSGQGEGCTQQQSHLSTGLLSDVSYKASGPASHLITEIISLNKNKVEKKTPSFILMTHFPFNSHATHISGLKKGEEGTGDW